MKRNNMDAIKVDENNKEHGINVLEPIGYLYHKQTASRRVRRKEITIE